MKTKLQRFWYPVRILVVIDQLLNVIAFGYIDETISSRSGRACAKGKLWGRWMCRFLDIFQRDHCRIARRDEAEHARFIAEIEEASLRSDEC